MEHFDRAWITGASSGIGRSLALRLAAEGCSVAVSARSLDALETLAKEAEPLTGLIAPYPLDVCDETAVRATFDQIETDLGAIDLCVANAGTHIPMNGKSPKAEVFRRLIDINVMGTVHVLEPVVPAMIARRAGKIAVVSSVAGYRGLASSAAYGATKAALINMSEAMRLELDGTGVVFQLVNPGFVATPLTAKNEFPMPFLMPVEKAADALYRGLCSNRFEITFPKRFTWLLKFARCLPYGVYLPLAGKITRQ